MRVDSLLTSSISEAGRTAADLEATGYSGVWTVEGPHDPFLWQHGTPLQFRGEFYRHTLMTPTFAPHAADLGDFGPPRIFLAGVGRLMTEVAGEVCDGFLCHQFTTEKFLREVTLPALERGRHKAGASRDGFEIAGPSFVVTGTDDEILNTIAVVAPPEQIAPELGRRYGDIVDRISFHTPPRGDPDRWQAVMDAIKAI